MQALKDDLGLIIAFVGLLAVPVGALLGFYALTAAGIIAAFAGDMYHDNKRWNKNSQ